jgi:raffinose/stachyose/melibiose transport system permease protein
MPVERGSRGAGEPGVSSLAYIAPAAALYTLFVLLPLIDGFWLSLHSWDGVSSKRWVGLGNYRELAHDGAVHSAFLHAVILCIFYAALPVLIGLFVSASLTRAHVRGMSFIKSALFLPQVIAAVVVGVSWRWLFDEYGPVNQALRKLGLGFVARAWLGDFTWALPAIGVIGTWVMLGLCMVLFLAGMQKIPTSLYDAARVDGAGAWREFLAVTLPGLRNELAIATTLTVIAALRAFDLIFVTTRGGPGDATLTPSLLLYSRAFLTGQVGQAAAIAIVLAAVVFVVALGITRVLEGGAA